MGSTQSLDFPTSPQPRGTAKSPPVRAFLSAARRPLVGRGPHRAAGEAVDIFRTRFLHQLRTHTCGQPGQPDLHPLLPMASEGAQTPSGSSLKLVYAVSQRLSLL